MSMPGEFECGRAVTLPASPDDVWAAVATKAGNAAWLFPNEIEPESATVTAWEPPHRFATRMEQGDWFNAVEYTIEGRDGGTSLLRYMHSGIFVDDWENQYDAVGQHTDFYLHTLGAYLQHFRGRGATYIGDVPHGIHGPPSSAGPEGFRRLQRALGLAADVGEGGSVRLTPTGIGPIEGVIGYLRPNFIEIRTADALYCFFGRNAFGAPVGMSVHSFADGIDAEQSKQDWQRWLEVALG